MFIPELINLHPLMEYLGNYQMIVYIYIIYIDINLEWTN